MKKLFVLLFIMNMVPMFAQPRIRLGAHVDPIISWFSPKSSQIDRDGARPGYSFGLIFENYFGPNYAFASGLSLTSLGGDILYNEPVTFTLGTGDVLLPSGTTVAFNSTYLTIPVSLKLKSNEIGYFTYFAQMGFSPQVNIGSRATSTGGYFRKETIAKEINLFNLSYFFGGGVEYNIGGQTSLVAGLFYNNGFADILSDNRHKAAFNYLTIRLGIMF